MKLPNTDFRKQFYNNIQDFFNNLPINRIAVSVSGGSDSIALLYLASQWAKENNKKLIVITVNHNLRPEAENECKFVEKVANGMGIECYILKWDHCHNFSNLQARARAGRYSLISNLCHELSVPALLTAHHQDDAIENYLIRQKRKSSALGLSISKIRYVNNLMVIRPFYNIGKESIKEYLYKSNIKWVEDESNKSDKYLRNKIRKSLEIQSENYKYVLSESISQANKEADLQKDELIAAIAETTIINNFGIAEINIDKLTKNHASAAHQVLSHIIATIGGGEFIPRYESTQKIIKENPKHEFTRSLGECSIKKINSSIYIYREFGKKKPEEITLKNQIIWDNRFILEVKKPLLKEYKICQLSLELYSPIKERINCEQLRKITQINHKIILFTLPAIKILEKIVAIPHISYYDDHELEDAINIYFSPKFISRFTHFC